MKLISLETTLAILEQIKSRAEGMVSFLEINASYPAHFNETDLKKAQSNLNHINSMIELTKDCASDWSNIYNHTKEIA